MDLWDLRPRRAPGGYEGCQTDGFGGVVWEMFNYERLGWEFQSDSESGTKGIDLSLSLD